MKKRTIRLTLAASLLAILCIMLSLAGCAKNDSKAADKKPAKKPDVQSVSIKYVGNSCFFIQASDGTAVVTDPYGASFAANFAPFPALTADAVTVSHYHTDHTSGIKEVSGSPKLILPRQLNEPIKVGSLTITGYPSKHIQDNSDNTVFIIQAGDFKIVHMGEADQITDAQALQALKNADVLLAYAGDLGEKKTPDIVKFAKEQGIKVIVPQHYSLDDDHLFYGEPTPAEIEKELPAGTNVVKLDELVVKKDMDEQFVELSPMGNQK